MANKVSAYGISTASYALVGRAVLLTQIPDRFLGGPVAKGITTRGEYLKTYFMAKVEFVASMIGMIFWGIATLCTLWQNQTCRDYFLAHASGFINSFAATIVGLVGTIYPEAGKTLGVLMLKVPVITAVALAEENVKDYFESLAKHLASYIPQEIRPAAGNIGRLFQHVRQEV